ncbi:MAG TPA: hypothetical protein VGM88_19920 [Kofleriaceae bacterium]|jgi:hypothetical protein
MPELTRRRALLWAALLGLAFVWFTGLIPRWGQWYSEQPYYRAQVHALFDGHLALTDRPEGVTHDVAWIDGGVQHVWGLGVPLWMSIFEGIGRVIHVSPFPDRVAMLAGIILALYVALRMWFGPGGDRTRASIGAFLIVAFLPGLVAMLRGRVAVYEEADTYAYGCAVLLAGGVMMMIRRPSRARYLLLVAFAGATGLVRPTVWFYGLAATGLATVLWIQYRGSVRRALAVVALGGALFTAGGGALYATNWLRFGAGTEFGHRLNLEDLPGNLYATRFAYPFEHEPIASAAKELAGAMFGEPEEHARVGNFYYDKKLARWQSPTARWREYYFTAYTWTYVPLVLVGALLVGFAWLRVRRPRVARGPDLDRETRWLGAWALLGGLPLLAFYLHSPSVSSRYYLDVGPTFAILVATTWRYVSVRIERRGAVLGTVAFVVFVAWWARETEAFRTRRMWLSPVRAPAAYVSMMDVVDPPIGPRGVPDAYDIDDPWVARYIGGDQWTCLCYVDRFGENACDHTLFERDTDVRMENGETHDRVIEKRIEHDVPLMTFSGGAWPTACTIDDPDAAPPDALPSPPSVTIETQDAPIALYRNGTNWDLTTGAVGVATYFFVEDPQFVEVTVAPENWRPTGPDFVPHVRAKVELEELPLVSAVTTPRGVRLRFAAPRTARYRHGLQVVFLAFGDPADLDQPISPYNLVRVAWR